MLFGLSRKTILDVNVVSDRNPLFVQLKDGGVRNGYTVRLLNKTHETRTFALRVEGLPGAKLAVVGMDNGQPSIDVQPDDVRSVKLYVTIPREKAATLPASAGIALAVRDIASGMETTRETNFRGPGQ